MVYTRCRLASCERIILADDDTGIDPRFEVDVPPLTRCMGGAEIHLALPGGRLETARILINRGALRAGDYPGTCGLRRSTMRRVGPYDGDVLFDNEEIVRHFALQGAKINYATDFFILKRPPTLTKWFEQRPRQAYEICNGRRPRHSFPFCHSSWRLRFHEEYAQGFSFWQLFF